MNDNVSRRVMAEVLKQQEQAERLASRITNETDGDKAAESLLSLLGLLKNGKSANEAVPELFHVTFLLQRALAAVNIW